MDIGVNLSRLKGCARYLVRTKKEKEMLEFYVVSTQAPPVLGLTSCLSLRLIKLILSVEKMQNPGQNQTDMIKEYSDVFEGLGTFPGVHKIHLKPDAVPVVHPPRRIPVALRDELEKELKRMEDLGVIVKVSESTDWANSIATPEKQRTGAVPPRLQRMMLRLQKYEMNVLRKPGKNIPVADTLS